MIQSLERLTKQGGNKMELIKPYFIIETETYTASYLETLERFIRVCYKSEDKIGEGSAEKLIKNCIKRRHWTVFEHLTMSVRFVVNRGFTHELVRHRLVSYLQESTRFCNYGGGITFIVPPWIIIPPGIYCNIFGDINYEIGIKEMKSAVRTDKDSHWFNVMSNAEFRYGELLKLGVKPEEARGVLPIDLKTEIIATANLREWRHIFQLRTSPKAHPQMREIMIPLLKEFKKRFLYLYDDINND